MTGFDDVTEKMRIALLPVCANVYTHTPNPRPERCIRLSQAGGAPVESGVAAWVLVTVECWESTNAKASDLAQSAMHAIMSWVDTGNVLEDVEVTWPVSYPDVTGSRYTLNARCFLLSS